MRNEDRIRWHRAFDLFVAVPVTYSFSNHKDLLAFRSLEENSLGCLMDQLLVSLMCNLWTLVSFRSWLVTLASSRSSWARSAFCVVNFWLWNLLHRCDCKISQRWNNFFEFPLISVFQRGPWASFECTRKANDSKATEPAGEGRKILLTRPLGGMTMPMPFLAMWLSHLVIRFDTCIGCIACCMTLAVAGCAFTAERCRAPGSATLRKQERRKLFFFHFLSKTLVRVVRVSFPRLFWKHKQRKISEEDLACSWPNEPAKPDFSTLWVWEHRGA